MSTYYDTTSAMQVLSHIYRHPAVLDLGEKYPISLIDFENSELHQVLFGAFYNLFHLGVTEYSVPVVVEYLMTKPEKYAVFTANKGEEYLPKLGEINQPAAFDYYFSKLKKFTLLRQYSKFGLNLSSLYDEDNIFDLKKKQLQEEWLDKTSLGDIADAIEKEILNIRIKHAEGISNDFSHAGKDIQSFLENLRNNPEYGYPLYGNLYNSIHRGARLGKLYIRSAATGVGKTRALVADACYIGCDRMYDLDTNTWKKIGNTEPVLFIATEQDEEEIQSLMLAFLSGVNEEHILSWEYLPGEEDRVREAAKIIEESGVQIKRLSNFSLQDIESVIKYSIREFKTNYIILDYIHTSMKMLEEIGSKSAIKSLREDNLLFLMSARLKEICENNFVFIETATQLNGDFKDAKVYDQNLLRGR